MHTTSFCFRKATVLIWREHHAGLSRNRGRPSTVRSSSPVGLEKKLGVCASLGWTPAPVHCSAQARVPPRTRPEESTRRVDLLLAGPLERPPCGATSASRDPETRVLLLQLPEYRTVRYRCRLGYSEMPATSFCANPRVPNRTVLLSGGRTEDYSRLNRRNRYAVRPLLRRLGRLVTIGARLHRYTRQRAAEARFATSSLVAPT
jgi:hypothetical protein